VGGTLGTKGVKDYLTVAGFSMKPIGIRWLSGFHHQE